METKVLSLNRENTKKQNLPENFDVLYLFVCFCVFLMIQDLNFYLFLSPHIVPNHMWRQIVGSLGWKAPFWIAVPFPPRMPPSHLFATISAAQNTTNGE